MITEDIRLVTAAGEHRRGADVYRFAFRRIWWARPIYLLALLPGLRWLFDRTYRWVADHRGMISRTCGIH
jgi:predicted DCC family thiol-disulfide oxidoreductase YuxK